MPLKNHKNTDGEQRTTTIPMFVHGTAAMTEKDDVTSVAVDVTSVAVDVISDFGY